VSVNDVATRKAAAQLTPSDKVFLALLDMVRIPAIVIGQSGRS